MRISDWSSDVCSSDLARGDEVVEDILLLVEPPGVVPRLAIFAAAAQVRDREHAALVDPREPGRREGGGHRDVEATIAIEQRRSEEHTSELQSLMRISYSVFCFKKKKIIKTKQQTGSHYSVKHKH